MLFSAEVGKKDGLFSATADRELYPSSSCRVGPVSENTISESLMHTWGTSEAEYDGGLALDSVVNDDRNSTGVLRSVNDGHWLLVITPGDVPSPGVGLINQSDRLRRRTICRCRTLSYRLRLPASNDELTHGLACMLGDEPPHV